ncbi:MAG: GSCFA domain-containing protein, partial [Bacteroidota bacterium]
MPDRFRTTFKPVASPSKIEYGHHLLALGSCFADRMGRRMAQLKLNVLPNPMGIAYHPLAIGRLLEFATTSGKPDLVFAPHLAQWVSWDLHSRYNHPEQAELLANFQADVALVKHRLASLDWLIVTFGTAYVYRHLSTDQWVNNNHRFPAKEFQGELLPSHAIVEYWSNLLPRLREIRP